MNREIRKLSKKIDELQKQINYQNECIMDQSMIIHELKEKIIGYSPYLDERFTGPIKPKNPYKPYTPKDNLPDEYPRNPWLSGNVTCLHCGQDTGIPMLLHMVIPPEGLKCPHCGRTAVYSNSPTCQEPFSIKAVPCTGDDPTMPWQTTTLKPYESVCTSTTNLDPNIKAYNNIEHIRDEDNICGGVRVTREMTPVYHKSYDGIMTTLPVSTPEKWTVTEKLPVVKTDSANLDASF